MYFVQLYKEHLTRRLHGPVCLFFTSEFTSGRPAALYLFTTLIVEFEELCKPKSKVVLVSDTEGISIGRMHGQVKFHLQCQIHQQCHETHCCKLVRISHKLTQEQLKLDLMSVNNNDDAHVRSQTLYRKINQQ